MWWLYAGRVVSFTEPSCPSGKRVYLTYTHAAHDARAMRRNGKRDTARAYPCTTCHKFHTGGDLT